MEFGIMAMQLNELIPAGVSTDTANKHLLSFNHAALVRKLAIHGFKWIELGGDLSLFFPQAFNQDAIEQLNALKVELDFSYTVHLPLWSVEPSTPLQPVRSGSVQAVVDIINITKPLQPEVYVLHGTGALAAEFSRINFPKTTRDQILKLFQSNASDSLFSILSETGIPSRKLALETIEFPFDLTMELIEKHDLSVCLDTGHVIVGFSGEINFFEALEQCLPRLAEIHLHDGPDFKKTRQLGYGLDHQALGKGDLDVKKFLQILQDRSFSGPIIFELTIEEALSSIEMIRKQSYLAGG